jgi:Skp family chaperone for outer membrane proteins
MTFPRIAVVVGVLVALAATAVIAILLTLRTMPEATTAAPEATTAAGRTAVPEATSAAGSTTEPEETMPAGTPAAPAAADEPLKIAVVDVGMVFRESAAVKSINTQLRPYLESFRADAAKVEQELRDSQDELARRQATVLTPDASVAERHDLEQRALEAQEKVVRRKHSLDQAQTAAMRKVETTLNKIVLQIFTERKLTLILRRDQTAFFNPALDITKEVITRLDQQLPTVEIAAPGP